MDKKRSPLRVSFILKAVAVAMGFASVAISGLKTGPVEQVGLLLSIGLSCLALSSLNDKND